MRKVQPESDVANDATADGVQTGITTLAHHMQMSVDGLPSVGHGEARANANIALIKYWGKADDELIIPTTSSLSLTLDGLSTRTEVTFMDTTFGSDELIVDDQPRTGKALARVSKLLDLVRERSGIESPAQVNSYNTVPYGAGLASSSSAFAALAGAAFAAAGLALDRKHISQVARRGSGSACRSVYGGLVQWHAGHDDLSSYAEPVETDMDLALIVVLVSAQEKYISSRQAMRHTVSTSPLYQAWVEQSKEDLQQALDAVKVNDLTALGEVVEANALGMHAAMFAARPAVSYWLPETVMALDAVRQIRSDGLNAWATLDAGPNIKVLTSGEQAVTVANMLRKWLPGVNIQIHKPGSGLQIFDSE